MERKDSSPTSVLTASHSTQAIRVYVVDDHALVRVGLTRILAGDGLDVVGSTESGSRALAELRSCHADLVLIDDELTSEPNGAALCQALVATPFDLRVLGLSSQGDAQRVRDLLQAGAHGVLAKEAHSTHIVEAVRLVAAGGSYLDPLLSSQLMAALSPPRVLTADLTPVQRQVLAQMAQGCSNQDIAKALTMSLGSAKIHVSGLLSALGVSTRTEAVALAARRGWLTTPPPSPSSRTHPHPTETP